MKPALKRLHELGFTLIELLAVVLILGLGATMLAPALARTQPSGRTVLCLKNHRQLIAAWRMYAEDNGDKLIYNFSASATGAEISAQTYRNWANNVLDWTVNSMNTNTTLLAKGILAPYLGGNVALYHCPADTYASAVQRALGWQYRTRSISMNGFFGPYNLSNNSTANTFYPTYRQWLKTGQVPQPANFWVLTDEHPDSINDGLFIDNPNIAGASSWGDIPGSYHNGAANLAFADGHVETHKWLSNSTKLPVRFFYFSSALDPLGRSDYQWLMTRATVLR